jgi:hypothetical protein
VFSPLLEKQTDNAPVFKDSLKKLYTIKLTPPFRANMWIGDKEWQ